MRVLQVLVAVVIVSSLMMCSFLTGAVATGVAFRSGLRPLAAIAPIADGSAPADIQEQFRIFWEAWRIAHQHYVDEKALDDQRMIYGAIQGMLDTLGDQGHTRFMSPREAAFQSESLSGSFSGIGAEVTRRDGRPVIVTPIEGTPAERAGIKAGDVVLKVNGEDTADLTLDEVINRIRGQEGTDVNLTILRPSTNETIPMTITRARITVRTVSSQMVPGTQISHIRLNQFSANATRELEAALDAAKQAGARGIILDLRNNPGGLLNEAVNVTSQFISQGNVLIQRDRGGKETPYPARRGGRGLDIPMVVLINQGSASAAEITAGALQHHDRAELVGTTTFGTGTVLNTFKLSDGSALLLGTGEWLTPGGRMIRRQGIEPDILVELPADTELLTPQRMRNMSPADIEASADAQVKEALRLLQPKP